MEKKEIDELKKTLGLGQEGVAVARKAGSTPTRLPPPSTGTERR